MDSVGHHVRGSPKIARGVPYWLPIGSGARLKVLAEGAILPGQNHRTLIDSGQLVKLLHVYK